MRIGGAVIIDIGQYYTKAGIKSDFTPLKLVKTLNHIIFEPLKGAGEYPGFAGSKAKMLQGLGEEQAYHLVHEFLEHLFYQ
jgi:hypothetical protein